MHRDGVRCKPRRDQRLFETRRIIKPVQSRCHKRPLFHARVFGDVGDQPPAGMEQAMQFGDHRPVAIGEVQNVERLHRVQCTRGEGHPPQRRGQRRDCYFARSAEIVGDRAPQFDHRRGVFGGEVADLDNRLATDIAPQSPARSAPPDSPRILGERSRRIPRGSGARSGPRCGRGSLMAPWFQSQGATGEPDPHTAGQRNVRQRALIGWNLYRHYH